MKAFYVLFATLFGSVYSMVVNNSITFSTNECGYSNIIYNNSLSDLNPTDNVVFYNFQSDASNCGPQNTTLGCVHLQHMTGPFSMFGYTPYTIWYYPYPINNSYTMNLFYNYNGGSTIMIGAVPCNDNLYMLGLTNCAFNQQLFSYQFYKYYLFNFYIQCGYNGTTMSLKIDESADTCVGFDTNQKCIVNHNQMNLVDFQDWVPVPFDYSYDTSDYGVYTTSTVDAPTETVNVTVFQNVTVTENITVTATGVTLTVTETGSSGATLTVTETGSSGTTLTVTETGSSGATLTVTETGSSGATLTVTETGSGATLTVTETGSSGATLTVTETGSIVTVTDTATVTETTTVTNTTSTINSTATTTS